MTSRRDNVFNKKIIGRNKDYIITMDNNLIPIKDIINIEAEKSLLSTMTLADYAIEKASETLTAQSFSDQKNSILFTKRRSHRTSFFMHL